MSSSFGDSVAPLDGVRQTELVLPVHRLFDAVVAVASSNRALRARVVPNASFVATYGANAAASVETYLTDVGSTEAQPTYVALVTLGKLARPRALSDALPLETVHLGRRPRRWRTSRTTTACRAPCSRASAPRRWPRCSDSSSRCATA
jgi:hypothetical protein